MSRDDATGEKSGEGHHGEAVIPSDTEPAQPGDLVLNAVTRFPEPLVGSGLASPLGEDEPEGIIPPSPLWAMKDRRHSQVQLPLVGAHERIREALGQGEAAVYLIDDGRHHLMVGRQVGISAEGCHYSLVGRISAEQGSALRQGRRAPAAAFDEATELALCGTTIDEQSASANVFEVARYGDLAEVPVEYRPGAPYREFPEDLEISV